MAVVQHDPAHVECCASAASIAGLISSPFRRIGVRSISRATVVRGLRCRGPLGVNSSVTAADR
jgi:hypothetical protein